MSAQGRLTSILILALCTLAGCASTKTVPVDHKALTGLQGGTVVAVSRPLPGFSAMTAGKAGLMAFGAIGGAIAGATMVSAGNAIVKENEIPDPAIRIKEALLHDLTVNGALKPVANSTVVMTTDVAELAKQYAGSADLLLDVQTTGWMFSYFPTNWNRYRVVYGAKLRLIDIKHAKAIAEGFCGRNPEKADDAPTKDELLENKAARLKQELTADADYCINEFRTKVLEEPQLQATLQ